MSPVEQTSTSSGAHPSSARRRRTSRSASATPGSPVAALALPLLSTTAAAWPPVCSRWRAVTISDRRGGHLVGGEHRRPPGRAAPSAVATSARSGSPVGLMPRGMPAATKPFARHDAHAAPVHHRRSLALAAGVRSFARSRVQADDAGGRWSRGGRGRGWRTGSPGPTAPFTEVVDGAEGDDPAGALVVARGHVGACWSRASALVDGEPSMTTTNGSSA